MPPLDPISNPVRLPVTLGTSPKTRSLTSAEEVRHTDLVPGSTDNDSDSWRKFLKSKLAEGFDALPNPDAFTLDKVVVVDGKFYTLTEGEDDQASGYANQVSSGVLQFAGLSTSGFNVDFSPALGRFTHNPRTSSTLPTLYGGVIEQEYFREEGGIVARVVVLQSAYNTAKGSLVATGDTLTVRVSDGATTATLLLTLSTLSSFFATGGANSVNYSNFELELSTRANLATAHSEMNKFRRLMRGSSRFTLETWVGPISDNKPLGVPSGKGWTEIAEPQTTEILQKINDLDNVIIRVIPDGDSLPALADFRESELVFWRGEFYHKGVSDKSISLSFRSASDRSLHGFSIGALGQSIVNPDQQFYGLYADSSQIEFYIGVAEYRAAKGSNESLGDQVSATIVTQESTPRTQTITLVYSGSGISGFGSKSYLLFTASRTGTILDSSLNGNVVEVALSRGGDDFMRQPSVPHEAWVIYDLAHAQRNQREIDRIEGELFDTDGGVHQQLRNLETRMETQEEKTSHITIDEDPAWATVDNSPSGGKYPYGRWQWINNQGSERRDGSNIENYKNRDYDSMRNANHGGFDGTGAGLLWALPNNINWSRVRLTVYRSDGSIKSIITGQSLRNAPNSVSSTIRNLPGSPPDVTVRWSAHSDSDPYPISNIVRTDTVLLQSLEDEHNPEWEGSLAGGIPVPDAPGVGNRDGKALKFKSNQIGYYPSIGKGELLAILGARARANLNGSESFVLTPNALGAAGLLSSSSNTLWINSRAVAKSRTYGIMVEVTRGTPAALISRIFVPWTAFRTGSGSYVTGGSHVGRQGVFVGHWDDVNDNSAIFGELSWSGGNFGIHLGGDRADNSSTLTIFTAQ